MRGKDGARRLQKLQNPKVLLIPPRWNEYIPKKNRHSESVPKAWQGTGSRSRGGARSWEGPLECGSSQNGFLNANCANNDMFVTTEVVKIWWFLVEQEKFPKGEPHLPVVQ